MMVHILFHIGGLRGGNGKWTTSLFDFKKRLRGKESEPRTKFTLFLVIVITT